MIWYMSLLGLVALLLAIWVIYDVWAKQKRMKTGRKVLWTVFAVLFSVLTAIIYFFVVKWK
jgi:hypothetical protein